jgi:hypothetical protein
MYIPTENRWEYMLHKLPIQGPTGGVSLNGIIYLTIAGKLYKYTPATTFELVTVPFEDYVVGVMAEPEAEHLFVISVESCIYELDRNYTVVRIYETSEVFAFVQDEPVYHQQVISGLVYFSMGQHPDIFCLNH